MTDEEKTSQFNQRADNAALALKGQLSQQHGVEIPERKVEVGPDGQPPKPPPPEGSYARMAHDEQRRQQAAQAAAAAAQQPPAQPSPAAAPPAEPPPQTAQPPQAPETPELSAKAQERFTKLTQDLREKDRELQQVLEQAKTQNQTIAETRSELEALKQQHEQMLQANLENLDPEARIQILQDARLQEMFADFEKRLVSNLEPTLQPLLEEREQRQISLLAHKYPAFDVNVHLPLISIYREKNAHSSFEQAFKAIAEPEELVTSGAAPATVAPPAVAPRPSFQSPTSPQHAAAPQSDPEAELVEEAAQAAKLRRSLDPAEQKQGLRLMDQHIARRLGDRLPGRR